MYVMKKQPVSTGKHLKEDFFNVARIGNEAGVPIRNIEAPEYSSGYYTFKMDCGHEITASMRTMEEFGSIIVDAAKMAETDIAFLGKYDGGLNADMKNLISAGYSAVVENANLPESIYEELDKNTIITKLTDATVKDIRERLETCRPCALPLDLDLDGSTDYAIITLPDPEYTERKWASFFTGIPEEELRNIDGSGKDWNYIVISHEIEHTGQENQPMASFAAYINRAETTYKREVDADKKALANYRASDEFNSSAEVVDDYINGRALGTFLRGDDTHATAPSLNGHDYEYSDVVSLFAKMVNYLSEEIGIEVKHAASELDSNHELVYETAKQMYHKGLFDDNPGNKAHVEIFLAAAKEYAPEYLDVDEKNSAIKELKSTNKYKMDNTFKSANTGLSGQFNEKMNGPVFSPDPHGNKLFPSRDMQPEVQKPLAPALPEFTPS
jgi:hypothetical protein